MPDTYQCAACDGVFDKCWSDDEAAAERDENFPGLEPEDQAVVCDDCYRKMMGLPPLD